MKFLKVIKLHKKLRNIQNFNSKLPYINKAIVRIEDKLKLIPFIILLLINGAIINKSISEIIQSFKLFTYDLVADPGFHNNLLNNNE